MEKLRVGFVSTFRKSYSEWCRQMRQSGLNVLKNIETIETFFPHSIDEGNALPGIPEGAVNTLDHAEILADFFIARKVQTLVVCPLDFGDERTVSKIAERLRVPLMLYATKEPPGIDDSSLKRVSDSYCGTLSIAAGLKRRKIPFYFGGIFFHEEPEFYTALDTFLRAASVVAAFKGARIGQIGQRPSAFETVAYDEIAMTVKFGMNIIHQDTATMLKAAAELPVDNLSLLNNLKAFKSEIDEISISDEQVLQMARMETAIKVFAESNHLSALGINCWPAMRQQAGLSPCALFGRLTEQGLLTACETDVMGSLAMLAQYAASFGSTPPHFIDWTIQHRKNSNQFLAWHCGNAPTCLAKPGSPIALRSRMDMSGSTPADPLDEQAGLMQFQLAPGAVTMSRLVEYDGEWKMLITSGKIVPSEEILAGTWSWVEVADHAELYRTLVEEGFMHHASMIHGDRRDALRLACQLMDIKVVEV